MGLGGRVLERGKMGDLGKGWRISTMLSLQGCLWVCTVMIIKMMEDVKGKLYEAASDVAGHGVPSEAQAFRLHVLEDEEKSSRRHVLLLGGPRAESQALFERLVISPTAWRILRRCHR